MDREYYVLPYPEDEQSRVPMVSYIVCRFEISRNSATLKIRTKLTRGYGATQIPPESEEALEAFVVNKAR